MSQFSCGHSSDKTLSIVADSDEKLSVNVCNGCYDNNKENFKKFNFTKENQS